jgi:hypothetical protein
MGRDQLSDVFNLIEVRGLVSGGFAVRGDWISRFDIRYPLKLVAMVCGRARMTTDGIRGALELDAGDVAILNGRTRLVLEGGRGNGPPEEFTVRESDPFLRIDGADCGEADVIIGGHVAMSRTSFAERFRAVAGVPPLTYLSTWRMQLAQHALRGGDTRVGPLAIELGYTSESAFSNAFKREVGMSPLRYRASVRDESAAAGQSIGV